MRRINWMVLALALLVPASSWALGLSLSAGGGYQRQAEKGKVALEASPFFEVSLLRFEVPIEYQLKPESPALAVGVGAKVFVPITGLYVRGTYSVGGFLTDGKKTQSLIVGPGWQLSLFDLAGGFLEVTGEPQLAPERAFTVMARVGAFFNL